MTLNYPDFFNEIPTIKLTDELADFLGTFTNGELEFSYLDIVKQAGHSCPTVIGAYLMTYHGLASLYESQRAVRGEIKVEFSSASTEGVAGVIVGVVSHITGALSDTGFKGIAGQFNRNKLLFFNCDISASVRFTRQDTGQLINVFYDPGQVPFDSQVPALKKLCNNGLASEDDKRLFKRLWQARVQQIYLKSDQCIKLT